MGVLNLQLLLILPQGYLLARGVNYMLMCATGVVCVCDSCQCAVFLHCSMRDICRK